MEPAPRRELGGLKEIRIDWEMFNFVVWCVIGPHADLPRYIMFRHRSTYDASIQKDVAGLYFYALPRKGGVLWLPAKPRTPEQIGYLTHEMGHAVMNLTRHASFKPNGHTEETICYALAHGVEQVLKGIRRCPTPKSCLPSVKRRMARTRSKRK
jgi:hypothetical protein